MENPSVSEPVEEDVARVPVMSITELRSIMTGAGPFHDEVLIAEIERLRTALRVIRDFPLREQDNMVSANMRRLAAEGWQGE